MCTRSLFEGAAWRSAVHKLPTQGCFPVRGHRAPFPPCNIPPVPAPCPRGRLQLNPTHTKAFYNRAVALERLRQYDAAAADYSHVLTLDPQNAPASQNRGMLWQRQGRLHEALADLGQAVQLEPGAAAAWHALGEVHERLGSIEAAVADLQRWGRLQGGCGRRFCCCQRCYCWLPGRLAWPAYPPAYCICGPAAWACQTLLSCTAQPPDRCFHFCCAQAVHAMLPCPHWMSCRASALDL